MGIYSHVANWKNTLTKLGFAHNKSKGTVRQYYHSRRLRMESLESRRVLPVIHVTQLTDENDHFINDGDVSLRDAIEQSTAGDTIDFNPAIPNPSLNGGIISLTLGEIEFSASLIIDASMLPAGLTIHADVNSRIFSIVDTSSWPYDPPTVTLKGLKLTGGDVAGEGGAIRSEGILKLENCNIYGNSADAGGGVWVSVGGGGTTERIILDIQHADLRQSGHGLERVWKWRRDLCVRSMMDAE